jgi:hypothetical protein
MPSSPEQIFEALVPERLEDPGVAVGRMYRAAPRVDAHAGRRWPSLVKEARVFVASTTRPRGTKR